METMHVDLGKPEQVLTVFLDPDDVIAGEL